MEVEELVDWLAAHHHTDVIAVSPTRVESTYAGRRRAYEQVPPLMSPGSLLDDIERTAYWRQARK